MSSNKNNNHCLICGKGYHVCNTCRDIKQFRPWRTIVDTINCYNIYSTLSEYNGKIIDKAEAKEQLERCDLSEKNSFKERPKNTINEILEDPKKTVKQRAKSRATDTVEVSDVIDTTKKDATNECE